MCKARHLVEQPAVLPGGFPTSLFGCSCVTQLQPGGVVQVQFRQVASFSLAPPGGVAVAWQLHCLTVG